MIFKNNRVFDNVISKLKNELPSIEQACYDENICYKYIHKIPLIYLRLLGLIHFKGDHKLIKCYRIFVIVCCWVCWVKFISVFEIFYGNSEPFNKNLILKICILIWVGIQCIHTTTMFIIMEKESYKNEFIRKLNYFLKKDENLQKSLIRLRKKVFLMFFVLFIFLILNTILNFLSFFGPKEFEPIFVYFLAPFHHPGDLVGNNAFYRLFQIYLIFCCSAVWTTLIVHFSTDCLTVEKILEDFNVKFSQYVFRVEKLATSIVDINAQLNLEDEFESLRMEHLKLCDLVLSLNKCNMVIVSSALIFYQASNLLIIYVISGWTSNCINGISAFTYPFWLITNVMIIAICIYRASQIFVFVIKIKIISSIDF